MPILFSYSIIMNWSKIPKLACSTQGENSENIKVRGYTIRRTRKLNMPLFYSVLFGKTHCDIFIFRAYKESDICHYSKTQESVKIKYLWVHGNIAHSMCIPATKMTDILTSWHHCHWCHLLQSLTSWVPCRPYWRLEANQQIIVDVKYLYHFLTSPR